MMKTRTRIKICGLTRTKDIKAAVKAGADALGFVFYKDSPRYVDPGHAAKLIKSVPPFVTTVGLFVNAKADQVKQIVKQTGISLLQFHGEESQRDCDEIATTVNLPFIRAFRIKPETKAADLVQYKEKYRADSTHFLALLLDTYTPAYGGSGKVFDWSVISKEIAHQVVLSGGLNEQNVAEGILRVSPFAVDVSSGVESARGIKSAAKIRAFANAVYAADGQARNR
jgi:phosphoribosylanthranilate isomerase